MRDLLLRVALDRSGPRQRRGGSSSGHSDRAGVIAQAARGVAATPSEVAAVDALVDRRLAGEPLQYVLGSWAFRSLELSVDPRVLIPRPETEVVVGHALDELGRLAEEAVEGGALVRDEILAVDLGTGSGAIAFSLAVEGPKRVGDLDLQVWATDVDAGSLSVAAANADERRCQLIVASHR